MYFTCDAVPKLLPAIGRPQDAFARIEVQLIPPYTETWLM